MYILFLLVKERCRRGPGNACETVILDEVTHCDHQEVRSFKPKVTVLHLIWNYLWENDCISPKVSRAGIDHLAGRISPAGGGLGTPVI